MKPVKIGFVLPCNLRNPLPSTRIAVLNMLPFLRAAHYEPDILFEPAGNDQQPALGDEAERLHAEGYRIVYFQKVFGPHVERLARRLSQLGVKTIFGVCDLVEPAMVDATDATIAVTDYLRSLYPPGLQRKIHLVHDGIEKADVCKTAWSDHAGSRRKPLRAVLVTSSSLEELPILGRPPDWLDVHIVGNYPPTGRYLRRVQSVRWSLLRQRREQRLNYLRFLVDRRISRVAWDPLGVYDNMLTADIGIIPIDVHAQALPGQPEPPWKVKSENRLTMKMACGLPVVATPIPSYRAVIEDGVNGFLASTRADWDRCLDALRDPALRRAMGEHARRSVIERFSMQEQARRFVAVCDGLLQHEPAPVLERSPD
jgi:glycosyltransferase involved in cell wall biosynthesis